MSAFRGRLPDTAIPLATLFVGLQFAYALFWLWVALAVQAGTWTHDLFGIDGINIITQAETGARYLGPLWLALLGTTLVLLILRSKLARVTFALTATVHLFGWIGNLSNPYYDGSWGVIVILLEALTVWPLYALLPEASRARN